MQYYLLSFVIGSLFFQIAGFLIVRRTLSRKGFVTCIGVTFALMLPIEWWATQNGIWLWSDTVTLYKVGKIPIEELILYITSAVTTVILFELIFKILSRRQQRDSQR
jgi:lycopene cyclase domain-containing protein